MKKLGLIGKNISYSFSRKYFSDKFEKEQIKNLEYINFDVENLSKIPSILRDTNHLGFNVTIPYKEQIITFLDTLDAHAKNIGAVNTIIKKSDKLIGSNTDWIGFLNSLPSDVKNNCKKALILGTGGASKAIAYSLQQLGIDYKKVSRNYEKGNLCYKDLNKEIIENHHFIIHTTPIGTYPNIASCIDFPFQYLSNRHFVYDLIYNPEITIFLQKSKEQGARIQNGHKMLIQQAEAAWKLWQIEK